MRVMLVLLVSASCATSDPLPTCAELGCKWAASGDPDRWTPCKDGTCFCDQPVPASACSRVPCGDGDACAAGSHAEFASYYITYPKLERVCFCDPD